MLGGLLSALCRKYKRTAVFIATAISILLTMKLGLAYLGGGYLADESHVATTPVPGDDGVVTTTAQRPRTASSG